ncbi:capsular biosynthesis protein [Paenibacillus sambharensis]|uniref:non-specific protein-tyrosine kinase n=1 Tax=Paenibacillus sambharensis TaxID=1803190 RepID=A0A2W1LLX1_9BACL|nr:CpsD/CapB family tyrosine-protein kinase [Paenibacillus sambharensis]PZD95514.1 capsular biosynthesis protein [Paenibacillus sambharensis]
MLRQNLKQAMVTEINPFSPVSESFRALRTHLQFVNQDEPLRVITAASAASGEGKTTTLVNLAIAYAQEGKRVVLIDGDMRRPNLHHVFAESNHVGLSNCLRDKLEATEVMRSTAIGGLFLIPSGPIPHNPAELLASRQMRELVEQLKGKADVVLIDGPPVLAVTDSKLIASYCDGVVLVVHTSKSKRELVKKAKEQLEAVKARVLGVVLNGQKHQANKSVYQYERAAK